MVFIFGFSLFFSLSQKSTHTKHQQQTMPTYSTSPSRRSHQSPVFSYNHLSVLAPNICFSKYICEETLDELSHWGVTLILNLCEWSEGLDAYTAPPGVLVFSAPIPDMDTLLDRQAMTITHELHTYLTMGHKICIHCKGGHGRSALMAGLLLSKQDPTLSPTDVLTMVYQAHQKRRVMKPRWRRMGAPQTKEQKAQIRRLVSVMCNRGDQRRSRR
jgi:hypothetical protein